MKPTKKPTETPCITSWKVTRGDAVAQKGNFPTPPAEYYPAKKIAPSSYAPVQRVERFLWRQRPILWESAQEIVVDINFCSSLRLVDVPRMQEQESVVIGSLTEAGRELSPRALLVFLTYASVLRTFWHLESTLCLLEERVEGDAYQAKISGQHIYYTSKKYSPEFSFQFEVRDSGELRVIRQ